MNIFGWIILCLFAIIGITLIILLVVPTIVSLIKSFSYRVKKLVEDVKIDIDAKSKERKLRAERLRNKQTELANKSLELKLIKIDRKITSEQKKIDIAKELDNVKTEKEEKTEQPKIEQSKTEVKVEEIKETEKQEETKQETVAENTETTENIDNQD